jgi:hypothetical protein
MSEINRLKILNDYSYSYLQLSLYEKTIPYSNRTYLILNEQDKTIIILTGFKTISNRLKILNMDQFFNDNNKDLSHFKSILHTSTLISIINTNTNDIPTVRNLVFATNQYFIIEVVYCFFFRNVIPLNTLLKSIYDGKSINNNISFELALAINGIYANTPELYNSFLEKKRLEMIQIKKLINDYSLNNFYVIPIIINQNKEYILLDGKSLFYLLNQHSNLKYYFISNIIINSNKITLYELNDFIRSNSVQNINNNDDNNFSNFSCISNFQLKVIETIICDDNILNEEDLIIDDKQQDFVKKWEFQLDIINKRKEKISFPTKLILPSIFGFIFNQLGWCTSIRNQIYSLCKNDLLNLKNQYNILFVMASGSNEEDFLYKYFKDLNKNLPIFENCGKEHLDLFSSTKNILTELMTDSLSITLGFINTKDVMDNNDILLSDKVNNVLFTYEYLFNKFNSNNYYNISDTEALEKFKISQWEKVMFYFIENTCTHKIYMGFSIKPVNILDNEWLQNILNYHFKIADKFPILYLHYLMRDTTRYPRKKFRIREFKTKINTNDIIKQITSLIQLREFYQKILSMKEVYVTKFITFYPHGYNIINTNDYYLSKQYNFNSEDEISFPPSIFNKTYMNKSYF